MIGPATKCLCDHRFSAHHSSGGTGCKSCKCKAFFYIPTYGSYDFKCLCKHSYKAHSPLTQDCTKCPCKGPLKSTWTCPCGLYYPEHQTIIEDFATRRARNK